MRREGDALVWERVVHCLRLWRHYPLGGRLVVYKDLDGQPEAGSMAIIPGWVEKSPLSTSRAKRTWLQTLRVETSEP